ncbi:MULTISPECIES: hypothetical protein [Streptomyces]|uniref:Uncharacterized protein n=1 Tax=Streptomyces eurythermus TaxID=42237 RepID=A0ABW6ZB22_9ACTN|nr:MULTISPECIES: hypothetical protein [Streptomyces]QIS74953.1 hypothetical protein HB370_37355 [Streptomyces sp. DSM 40868]
MQHLPAISWSSGRAGIRLGCAEKPPSFALGLGRTRSMRLQVISRIP